MTTTFNVLDLIFISVTIIIVSIAFLRGFIREIFALVAWLLSSFLSYLIAPFAAKFLSQYYSDNQIALEISCRMILFVLVFVIFIFATSDISKELSSKMSKTLDRSLGILYGLIKTLIVFGFIYSIAVNILLIAGGTSVKSKPIKESFPKWFVEAKCYNIIRSSGDTIDPAVKKFISGMSKNLGTKIPTPEKEESNELDKKIKEIHSESPTDIHPTEEDLGYTKKDVEKMRHLIEIIDNK